MELREAYTFRDLVLRLMQRRSLEGSPRDTALCQVAVQTAYREMVTSHDWQYYNRRIMFRTSPSQNLTVTYDHEGGAYPRLLTATVGTWPTDAAFGEFRINRELYKVERRISDTQVTLTIDANPGADTSGAGIWTRSSYTLPYQIRHVNEMYRANGSALVYFTPQAQTSRVEVLYDQSGTPWMFTLSPSVTVYGWTDVRLIPTPADAVNYRVNCTIRPNPLVNYEIFGIDGGGTSGSTSFTSASPSVPFTTSVVGSILRVTQGVKLPKDRLEYNEDRDDYAFQTRIVGVTNSTTLELENPLPFDLSGIGYSISDHVDIAPSIMLTYLEALSWYYFAHNHEVESIGLAKSVTQDELSSAIVADSQVNWTTFVKPEFVDFRRLGIIDRSSLRV